MRMRRGKTTKYDGFSCLAYKQSFYSFKWDTFSCGTDGSTCSLWVRGWPDVLFCQLEVPSENTEIGFILKTYMVHELKYENIVEKRTESWTQIGISTAEYKYTNRHRRVTIEQGHYLRALLGIVYWYIVRIGGGDVNV
jgi:hypothetical protein